MSNIRDLHPDRKLEEADVRRLLIKASKGVSNRNLSIMFGVSTTTIHHIKHGRKWPDLYKEFRMAKTNTLDMRFGVHSVTIEGTCFHQVATSNGCKFCEVGTKFPEACTRLNCCKEETGKDFDVCWKVRQASVHQYVEIGGKRLRAVHFLPEVLRRKDACKICILSKDEARCEKAKCLPSQNPDRLNFYYLEPLVRGKSHKVTLWDKDGNKIGEFKHQRDAANMLGVSHNMVWRSIHFQSLILGKYRATQDK